MHILDQIGYSLIFSIFVISHVLPSTNSTILLVESCIFPFTFMKAENISYQEKLPISS